MNRILRTYLMFEISYAENRLRISSLHVANEERSEKATCTFLQQGHHLNFMMGAR